MRARLLSLVLLLVTSLAATFAFAGPITVVPTDLSVGDQYRLVFVTSTTRDASSSDITVYNAFVSSVAGGEPALAALGTQWLAARLGGLYGDRRQLREQFGMDR